MKSKSLSFLFECVRKVSRVTGPLERGIEKKGRGGDEGKRNAPLRIWSVILLNSDMTHPAINLAQIDN